MPPQKKPRLSTTAKGKVKGKKSPVKKRGRSGRKKTARKNKVQSSLMGRYFNRTMIISTLLLVTSLMVVYLVILDERITERFEGRIWQLPAHVYARPLELFSGKAIAPAQLAYELDYLNYQKTDQLPHKAGSYRRWKDTFEIKTRDFEFWDGIEPSHTIRVSITDNHVVELLDIYANKEAGPVRFDAGYLTGIFPAHAQDRVLVRLDDVPDIFIKMLLLIEDRRFFEHAGIDPRSIARALLVNVTSGSATQGGSTLTQQLVKNLFLSQEKKLSRKINEAFMSLLLELHYDKKLILETYLNEVYLGQDGKRSIHGFGLASEFYFGKALDKLSIDEMAILVGMVKGASYYNPKRNPEHARERRDVVLKSMELAQLLTERQTNKLMEKPVTTVRHARAGRYPAFIDVVKTQLQQDYQAEDLRSEGLRVFTTIDPYVQHKTEQAVVTTLPQLAENRALQTAAVVVSPLSGDVLAVVGDRNPGFRGFNRALNAKRPIGSLIKPVIYLTAIESGKDYTLATMLDDSPLIYKDKQQPDWQPMNYDRKFHGDVTLYQAILRSYNIPAVRTILDIGAENVVDTLHALGYKPDVAAYPSLALGAIPMSPWDVASIYQAFSSTGYRNPLRSVFAVLDKDKRPLERYSLDVDNQVDPDAVAVINTALIGVTRYGTSRQLARTLPIQVAGKTGTSDDLRDSWFAGFSGDAVAVVWVGYDDNHPTTLTGSSGAMKVWQKIMVDVAYQPYQLPQSPGLEKHWIDLKNGLLTENSCENAVELTFLKGTSPTTESECETEQESNWFFDLFD